MLVACVKTGEKYSNQHVRWLHAALKRHMDKVEFVCITDDPTTPADELVQASMPGWWAKLQVFEWGLPLLFFDLDVVITASLKPLVNWDGFGIIQDWNEIGHADPGRPEGEDKIVTPMFNSSVMKLTGNERHVWKEFEHKADAVMQRFPRGGDQRWITARMPDAKTFPAEWFASYKMDNCQDGPPPGSLATIFHGYPKPWEIQDGWVADYYAALGKESA